MVLVLLFLFAVLGNAQVSQYFIGKMGQSCYQTCLAQGMNCNASIITNNSLAIFNQFGINCQPDTQPWWAEDQPSYVSGTGDPNYGKCVGYINVPQNVQCGGAYPTTQRLCNCQPVNSASDMSAFSIGISGGEITTTETDFFGWTLAAGTYGSMLHFWITGDNGVIGASTIRYYIDGETTASIQFNPGMAAGTGFADPQAPWGTKWIGKGANSGSWFNNIPVPFQKSIRCTWQCSSGNAGGMYVIARGAPNVPLTIGNVQMPPTTRLNLIVQNVVLQPLQYFDIVNFPAGTRGYHFFHTLAVQTGNENFLEGCYRFYSPPNQAYPGTLLATGTEDYFDSGWYFDAGEFHLPVAGFTHYNVAGNSLTWSAYRFHEMDPLLFTNGFRLTWRNGDAIDPQTGLKCFIQNGGDVVGSPTQSTVLSYAWVYTW